MTDMYYTATRWRVASVLGGKFEQMSGGHL